MYLEKIQIRNVGGDYMNKNKLFGIMRENNDTQEALAVAIGLSRGRLSAKMNEKRKAVFTLPEMKAIKDRYHLDIDTFNAIFFD